MELTTFGALLKFALELEEQAAKLYGEASRITRQTELQEGFQASAAAGKKHGKKLERIRRENINEMLLESIEGLRADDYQVKLKLSPEMGDNELLAAVLQLEGVLERFYRDAARRLSLPEVARGFARLAEAHAQRKAELGEI
jgi:rubrerythrin